MRSSLAALLLVAGFGAVVSFSASAEVLLIERAQEAKAAHLPTRGMSMNQVESKFGAPSEKRAAVGGANEKRPPITRWVYPQFTVYFENNHVINSVLNHASPDETGPKPTK